MTGDGGASTETGSGIGGVGYVGGTYWGGPRNAMTRGLYEQQAKLLLRQIRATQSAANLASAVILSHVPRGTPTATVQTNVPLEVTKLLVQLGQVAGQYIHARSARIAEHKRAHNEQAIAAKIRRKERRSPVPTYAQYALTGLNMGPPIPGATYY